MTTEDVLKTNNNEEKDTTKFIQVPIQTFPPTAMVYTVPKIDRQVDVIDKTTENDVVPMTLIAKALTQPAVKRSPQRVFICVKCLEDYSFSNKQTQTNCFRESEKGNNSGQIVSVHRKLRSASSSSISETES